MHELSKDYKMLNQACRFSYFSLGFHLLKSVKINPTSQDYEQIFNGFDN